jgi:hypothetical protein
MSTPSDDPVEKRLSEIRAFLDALSFFERNEARDHLARMKDFEMPLSKRGEELMDAILELDFEEQMAIVEKIECIHSRPPGVMSEDDPRFEDMLKERMRKIESGESKGVPWEEVMAKLDAKLGRLDPPTILPRPQD